MGCLYKLTSPSGKSYIGITSKALQTRWRKHVEQAKAEREGALYAAIRKYGPTEFTVTLLVEEHDWDTLCRLEREAIVLHRTFTPSGYNLTTGGEGVLGPRTEDARHRISVAQRKRFERPEERERMRGYARLAAQSPKRRAAYDAARKPKRPPMSREERGMRIRAALARPEVRSRVLACAAARAANPVWRANMSAAKTGQLMGPCSEQRKTLIAEARKREWADPVLREKRLAALALARAAKPTKVS